MSFVRPSWISLGLVRDAANGGLWKRGSADSMAACQEWVWLTLCMGGLVCLSKRGTSLLGRRIRVGSGTRKSRSRSHRHGHSRRREPRPRRSLKQEHRECTRTAVSRLSWEAADQLSDIPDKTLVWSSIRLCLYEGSLFVLGARARLFESSMIWIRRVDGVLKGDL